jgi:hypothetical protein
VPPPVWIMPSSSVVERLTVNQDVAGSIPAWAAIFTSEPCLACGCDPCDCDWGHGPTLMAPHSASSDTFFDVSSRIFFDAPSWGSRPETASSRDTPFRASLISLKARL